MLKDITSPTAPAMPKLGKGTECIKLLLSQTSKDMHEPLVPMLFPVLGAHVSGAEFQYPDNSWKELCGQMANLVADSGCNKGQLTLLIEAINRDFRKHDEEDMKKLVEWQKLVKTKSSNSTKPPRPEVAFWFPPCDITRPAFIQNAMACENQGGRTQYINIPEVEMLDSLCGGHKQVTLMIRNIYDRAYAGALRATADGITGNPLLRTCISISSTPGATRGYYKRELFNGTFSRIVFSYKTRDKRDGKIPRIGEFGKEFHENLDAYLARLDNCNGRYIIEPLNNLIDKLSDDMASLGDVTDDDEAWGISKCCLVSAWKAGCVMWALNNQQWTRAMGNLVEWLVWHDLWSKYQVLGDMLKDGDTSTAEASKSGPTNMLEKIEGSCFSEKQLDDLRASLGKPTGAATRKQLSVWSARGFITVSEQTGLYTKTDRYLKKMKG